MRANCYTNVQLHRVIIYIYTSYIHTHTGYCAGVLHGKVDPLSLPIVEDRLPSLVHCDAQRGYAPVAFERALPLLADKAKRNGIAALCVQNR